jgi:hypothetical protein
MQMEHCGFVDVHYADDVGNHYWLQRSVEAINALKDHYGKALELWINQKGHLRMKLESKSPNLDLPII